jgi:(1->4)-alpha-D-glucan 1-alpha-D-glucosylmutase
VVEKILRGADVLPAEWPVMGSTGYDFALAVNDVFLDRKGLERLARSYIDFTGMTASFADVVYNKKKQIIEGLFPGEVRSLSRRLFELAKQDRCARDLSENNILQALIEVTACLPVYRTYIRSVDISDGPVLFKAGF